MLSFCSPMLCGRVSGTQNIAASDLQFAQNPFSLQPPTVARSAPSVK